VPGRLDRAWPSDAPARARRAVRGDKLSGRAAFVTMMETTHLGDRHDGPIAGRRDRTRNRRVLVQRQVRAGFVIVTEVVFEYSAQLVVIDHNHMIEALATNASDDAFHVAILPRTPWCNANFFDAHSFNPRPEEFAIDSVAVSNHKPRGAVFRKCFDDLLCSPNRRWMLRDIEVDDAATIVRQDDELG